MKKHLLPLIAALVTLSFLASQSTPARAQAGFTFMDDEAEPYGYDVTATLSTLPVEWILAGAENGDGYRLKISSTGVELALQEKGKAQTLATAQLKLQPGNLLVQQRGLIWRVFLDHQLILEAEHEGGDEGAIGYRGNLKDARVQPVEEVYFDDDFMRIAMEVAIEKALVNPKQGVRVDSVEFEETIWTSLQGAFVTTGLSENVQAQVAQSANPFAFESQAKGASLAVAGRDFWSDYATEVAVKPQGAAAVGVAVYVQDENNYLLFHWPQNGPAQLRAVKNGKTEVLAEAPAGYDQNQWYKMRLAIVDGTLRAFIDDTEVLRTRARVFGRGLVGLYAENPEADKNAVFDDVAVRTVPERHDDFAVRVAGRWHNVGGEWQMQGAARPANDNGAFAVMGERDWFNYIANAEITLPTDGSAGLLLHHQSGAGAYLLRVAGSKAKWPYAGRAQILKIDGGKSEVLADIETAARFDNSTQEWSFSSENGYLRASVNGRRLADAYDTSLPQGRAGIYAQRGASGSPELKTFVVAFPREQRTWAKVPELYVEERQAETMGGWSTPEGLWAPDSPIGLAAPNDKADAAKEKTLWHKGTFWGDSSIRVALPELKPEEHLNLLLGEGASTLRLTLSRESTKIKAVLTRVDTTPNAATPANPTALSTGEWTMEHEDSERHIEVARRGSYLIVRASEDGEWSTLLTARAYS